MDVLDRCIVFLYNDCRGKKTRHPKGANMDNDLNPDIQKQIDEANVIFDEG